MKDGLKLKLFELIKSKGYVPYQEIVDTTNRLGFKVDNATRRLRELTDVTESNPNPLVEKVKDNKGVIIGYRYIKYPESIKVPKPAQTPITAKPMALFDTPSPKFKSHYE